MEPAAKGQGEPALADRQPIQVLGHPIRARIAVELKEGGMSLVEMAEALGEPLLCVSYHAKVLAMSGRGCCGR